MIRTLFQRRGMEPAGSRTCVFDIGSFLLVWLLPSVAAPCKARPKWPGSWWPVAERDGLGADVSLCGGGHRSQYRRAWHQGREAVSRSLAGGAATPDPRVAEAA